MSDKEIYTSHEKVHNLFINLTHHINLFIVYCWKFDAGFMGAMISNLAFVFRNIFSKKGMKGKSVSGMNYYACLSMLSLAILLPFAFAMEGPKVWAAGWQKAVAEIGPNFVWWASHAFLCTTSHRFTVTTITSVEIFGYQLGKKFLVISAWPKLSNSFSMQHFVLSVTSLKYSIQKEPLSINIDIGSSYHYHFLLSSNIFFSSFWKRNKKYQKIWWYFCVIIQLIHVAMDFSVVL